MGVTFGIPGQCLIVGSSTVYCSGGLESLRSDLSFDKIPRCRWMAYINVYYYLVSSITIWKKLW